MADLNRRQAAALYVLPPLFCLLVYWPGLIAWLQQDDFAWMGLYREYREGSSLWELLFRPSQHGTLRPLGERAFFLLSQALFGYEAWPMRVAAFATHFGSMALSAAITLRLTRSVGAAVLAPLLWTANSKLIIPMISNGAYIHLLCAFFLLAAIYSFLRSFEDARWRVAAWAAFLLGFGAMETAVVLPALLSALCFAVARDRLRETAWYWAVSIVYLAIHMAIAPKMAGGSYAMHIDAAIVRTLGTYWMWIYQPVNLQAFTGIDPRAAVIVAWAATVALAAFVAVQAARKQFVPALFLAWFVILLSPVLPLSGHVTDYYLTVPLFAWAMLAATATAAALRSSISARSGAALLLGAYLLLSVPVAHRGTRWWQMRSQAAEALVRKVFAVHRANPHATILLQNVSDEQFWAALAHYPFVVNKRTYVYLERGTETRIEPHPESGVRLEQFFLTPAEEERLRSEGRLITVSSPQDSTR